MYIPREKLIEEIKNACVQVKKDVADGKLKNADNELLDLTDNQVEYLCEELQKLMSSKKGLMNFALHSKRIISDLAKKVKEIK